MRLKSIEVVEDRTEQSTCSEGFLSLARLILRNRYEDGSASADYACDVVSRRHTDAVVAVLFEIDGKRRVHVLLRKSPRAPIYLRRFKKLALPDDRDYTEICELVAGLIEPSDAREKDGLRRRAAQEAREEAGLVVSEKSFQALGGATFASPGTTDEKFVYLAAEARLDQREKAHGDGSVMEECGEILTLELSEAIRLCRDGTIPDLKTEVGLLRLCDHIGYLPQLGCFADELPRELAAGYQRLGLAQEP